MCMIFNLLSVIHAVNSFIKSHRLFTYTCYRPCFRSYFIFYVIVSFVLEHLHIVIFIPFSSLHNMFCCKFTINALLLEAF